MLVAITAVKRVFPQEHNDPSLTSPGKHDSDGKPDPKPKRWK